MMTGERVGVGHDPSRRAAYVESWVTVRKEDPREIRRAAVDTQKISDLRAGLDLRRQLEIYDKAYSAYHRVFCTSAYFRLSPTQIPIDPSWLPLPAFGSLASARRYPPSPGLSCVPFDAARNRCLRLDPV